VGELREDCIPSVLKRTYLITRVLLVALPVLAGVLTQQLPWLLSLLQAIVNYPLIISGR
jgi:hypothetical protein